MIIGELKDNKVIIHDEKEASQIYNRGYHGKPQSGGGLELSLIEALYLFESERIIIKKKVRRQSFKQLIRHANKLTPDFEIKYIVYRDLRQRGYVVKPDISPLDFRVFPRGGVPSKDPSKFWVYAASERAIFNFEDMKKEIRRVLRARKKLLVGIVDEEGDLTYYQARLVKPKGKVKPKRFKIKSEALFLGDRVLIPDFETGETLHESEFFGKFIGEGLQLSLLETAYLMENNVITLKNASSGRSINPEQFKRKARKIQPDFDVRLEIYNDLKSKGMIVKTGFKYGTHFRVYKGDPDTQHALYLVHAVLPDFKTAWPEISRAVRLAHGVKKEMLFGRVANEKAEYLRLKRVRP